MAADRLSTVRHALAAVFDGAALDPSGNVVKAYSADPDSLTPPAVVVRTDGVRWADTGRPSSLYVVDATITLYLPSLSAPVAAVLASRFMDDAHPALQGAGRTLGGACGAWQLIGATRGMAEVGSRVLSTVDISLQIWI